MYILHNIKKYAMYYSHIIICKMILYIQNILLYLFNFLKNIITLIKIYTIHNYIDYMMFTDDIYHISIRYCVTSLLIKILFDIIKNYYFIGIEIFLNIYLFIIYTAFYNLITQIYNHNANKFYITVVYMLLNVAIYIYTN
jgi:hypothetical protein